MDLRFVKNGLGIFEGRKKRLLLAAALGFTAYGAYRVHNMPSVSSKRKRFFKILSILFSVAEMVSDSAELCGGISEDVKEFLQSDSDQIPNSLKQISKIVSSEEFRGSLIRVSQALTAGILLGHQQGKRNDTEQHGDSNFSAVVMNKLFSEAGTGFVSVVVGSFARNLVLGYFSSIDPDGNSSVNRHGNVPDFASSSSTVSTWLDVVCDDKSRKLIADCIQKLVSTAVAVYLDKTMDINTYDDLFAGMTNPKHHNKVTDLMVSVCKGSMETLVKTSHQVLNSKLDLDIHSNSFQVEFPSASREKLSEAPPKNGRWVKQVSSTLAVPSNRRFVLDVTGRVTFETVRSVVELFMCKIFEVLKRSVVVVHGVVVERGFELIGYLGGRAYVILTICLALWLHIVGGTRL